MNKPLSKKNKKLLEKVMKQLEGRELFPKSNARAREILKNIKFKSSKDVWKKGE